MNYAYDIRVFFHFLMENNPVYKEYTIDRFHVTDLDRLEPVDIEEYMEYLKVYRRDDDEVMTNGRKALPGRCPRFAVSMPTTTGMAI